MQKHRVTKNGHSHTSPRQMFTKATLRALSKAQDTGHHVVESTERAVRLHPAAALGIAFASGVVVAMLARVFMRRDD